MAACWMNFKDGGAMGVSASPSHLPHPPPNSSHRLAHAGPLRLDFGA